MDKYIDLHTHSTASDGSMSPTALVRHAAENGLAAIALTDHDTIGGVFEALEEGKRIGIEVVAGLEISVAFNPEMHILGYFFDERYLAIDNVLASLKRNREERNPKIVSKLNKLGYKISMEEVIEKALGEIIGRLHIANVLVEKGYAGNVEEAFDKFLLRGRPAFVEKDKLTPEEGINEITKAGGIPVLAHPVFLEMSFAQLDELLVRLKRAGLRGLEAYYTDNDESDTRNFLELADRNGLMVTGGSDFHGAYKNDIMIGKGYGNLIIPYELLDRLKK